MKFIYIYGGGTFSPVRAHLSLSTPAFGETARKLKALIDHKLVREGLDNDYRTILVLTKMADPQNSQIMTNDDVWEDLDSVIKMPSTKAIIFNVAMCDFKGSIGDIESGKYADRLETKAGYQMMELEPAEKIIGMIRKTRKDIFAVGFKTTSHQGSNEQYTRGLGLLKTNSLNLVLANDLVTRNNMIIAPEETRYSETTDRDMALRAMVDIMISRMQNTFTRSTVVEGDAIPWNSIMVPDTLRTVVDHCIKEGAYKPFQGKTAGHFAARIGEDKFLTSIRKSNFNYLDTTGLVKIESSGDDSVIAHGARPSVGGQSQRIIFREHEGLDCIVHFHCPPKDGVEISTASQWQNECGSHQCGKNTSDHLKEVDLGDGQSLKVVYLDQHGPNIVFNRNTDPQRVIEFIDRNFDLQAKTGGLVA